MGDRQSIISRSVDGLKARVEENLPSLERSQRAAFAHWVARCAFFNVRPVVTDEHAEPLCSAVDMLGKWSRGTSNVTKEDVRRATDAVEGVFSELNGFFAKDHAYASSALEAIRLALDATLVSGVDEHTIQRALKSTLEAYPANIRERVAGELWQRFDEIRDNRVHGEPSWKFVFTSPVNDVGSKEPAKADYKVNAAIQELVTDAITRVESKREHRFEEVFLEAERVLRDMKAEPLRVQSANVAMEACERRQSEHESRFVWLSVAFIAVSIVTIAFGVLFVRSTIYGGMGVSAPGDSVILTRALLERSVILVLGALLMLLVLTFLMKLAIAHLHSASAAEGRKAIVRMYINGSPPETRATESRDAKTNA